MVLKPRQVGFPRTYCTLCKIVLFKVANSFELSFVRPIAFNNARIFRVVRTIRGKFWKKGENEGTNKQRSHWWSFLSVNVHSLDKGVFSNGNVNLNFDSVRRRTFVVVDVNREELRRGRKEGEGGEEKKKKERKRRTPGRRNIAPVSYSVRGPVAI